MAGNPEAGPTRAFVGAAALAVGAGLCWLFPPFRIVPLHKAPGVTSTEPAGYGTFDPAAAAERIWQTDLPAAAVRAVELDVLVPVLRANPAQARARFAPGAGLGTAYYFVRGHGRVIARERNQLHLELAGPVPAVVALRLGPVFGNTVRDGCGLLDLNDFPGLQEFNALAAELNARVEKNVLPLLRDKAIIGAQIEFAACAEAPETVGGPAEPLLVLIPVQAAVP